jgi:hypothetical protein
MKKIPVSIALNAIRHRNRIAVNVLTDFILVLTVKQMSLLALPVEIIAKLVLALQLA